MLKGAVALQGHMAMTPIDVINVTWSLLTSVTDFNHYIPKALTALAYTGKCPRDIGSEELGIEPDESYQLNCV